MESGGGFLRGAELVSMNFGPCEDGAELARFTYPTDDSESAPDVSFFIAARFIEPGAGEWGKTIGASRVVRNSLRYVEEEVLPRFRGFF
jgi:hypothetical protein